MHLALYIVILIAVVAALAYMAVSGYLAWQKNQDWLETLRKDQEHIPEPDPEWGYIDRGPKKFSGNSHDRRVQRRAHGRQEKTHLS